MAFKKIKAAGGGSDFDPKAEAVRLYLGGKTLKEGAQQTGLSVSTCRRAVLAAGLEPRSTGEARSYSQVLVEQAVLLYRDGKTSTSIAATLGVGIATVVKWLRRNGVEVRTKSEASKVAKAPDPKKVEQAKRLRRQGMSSREIARELNTAQSTVMRWLRRDVNSLENPTNA